MSWKRRRRTTGASADHRWTVKPSELESVARLTYGNGPLDQAWQTGLAEPLLGNKGPFGAQPDSTQLKELPKWIDAVARDLQQHRGASIVIAGNEAPPSVHALAHAMNAALGNVGKTVTYTDPLEANPVDQRAVIERAGRGSRCGTRGTARDVGRQSGLQHAG